jgi:hypothetical protein
MKKFGLLYILFFVFMLLFLFVLANANAAAASTRAYCLYNGGSGNYACDSGWVGGNSASCSAANGAQCAEEGDVYCYAQSSCEAGTTNQGPTNAYNVNWDSDSADCSCKVGSGRWGIRFVSGTQSQCCGDDASEYYIAASNPKNIDKIDTCCKADAYVFNAVCCGDDASEYYAGSATGNSCDGTQACCSSPSNYVLNGNCVSACPSVSSVYFSDLAGNKITQADVNDYVMMIAETTGAEGSLINFSLWEAGATSCYSEGYSAYSHDNKAFVIWKVKVCPDGSSDGNKFRAFISTMPSLYKESELLSVGLAENDSLPVALILQPKEGSIFNVGETINFVSGSYDIDDPMTSVLWNFDVYGTGETSSIANTTHVYSSGGPKTVTLTVQNARGKTASIMTGILINSSANDPPLAIISQPAYGEKFSGMLITFNATNSIDDVKPFSQLIFRWEFDDGSTYTEKGMNGAYFTKLFSVAGEHNVKLTVDDSDPVSQTETVFYIKGCQVPLDGGYEFVPLGSCSSLSKHYFCANETTYYDTMNEHCEGADGMPLTTDDCCPRGFYCPNVAGACTERTTACGNYNTSEECSMYGCIWLNGTCSDPANMTSCSDYKNVEACSADVLGLGRAVGRGLGTDICGKVFGDYVIPKESCMCKWDGATCQFNYGVNKTIGGEGFITCIKSFGLTGCVAGTQTMNWIAKCSDWNNGVDCAKPDAQIQCSSGSKQVKCGTIVSKMPFFDLFNLILAMVIFGIYYAFMIKKS